VECGEYRLTTTTTTSEMKLVVLGASGQTGLCLIEQALSQGHTVTALVRTPSRITLQHERLHVLKASIFSVEDLTAAFRGQDAVLSTLGFSKFTMPAVTGYTDSARAILPAMRAAGVSRFIVMTAFYTDVVSSYDRGFIVSWCIIPIIKRVLVNMREMEVYLEKEAGDLDWTVVRPWMLWNGPLVEQVPLEQENAMFVADPRANSYISRATVAAFMLTQLGKQKYVRKAVAFAVQ